MRLHSFNVASSTLKIESSVPWRMVQSDHALRFVIASIQDAVAGANEFFEVRQIEFQRNAYLHLIDALNAKWGSSIH